MLCCTSRLNHNHNNAYEFAIVVAHNAYQVCYEIYIYILWNKYEPFQSISSFQHIPLCMLPSTNNGSSVETSFNGLLSDVSFAFIDRTHALISGVPTKHRHTYTHLHTVTQVTKQEAVDNILNVTVT